MALHRRIVSACDKLEKLGSTANTFPKLLGEDFRGAADSVENRKRKDSLGIGDGAPMSAFCSMDRLAGRWSGWSTITLDYIKSAQCNFLFQIHVTR